MAIDKPRQRAPSGTQLEAGIRGKSLEFLKALVSNPSPSGYEQPVAREYRPYSETFADELSTDVLGNVTAVLNPQAKSRVVLLAHMDEVGFIIHFISDEGLLYFSPIGGHDSVVPAGQRVWVHGRGKTTGVIGRAEFNLMTSEKKDARPELGELWIDIGARSQSEAEDHVAVGDVVTFQYEFQKLLGDRAASRAFDNKAGLWAIAEALRLLKEDGGLSPDVGVYAVATVQEEIGSRGAEVVTRSVSPQSGLAIDVGYARDHSAIDKRRSGQLEMGKGPGIACGPNANRMVFEILRSAAEDEKIPHQVTVFSTPAPTDGRVLQTSGAGVATGLIEIPLRYMHTPCEVVCLQDMSNTARLIAAYCRRLKPDSSFTVGGNKAR